MKRRNTTVEDYNANANETWLGLDGDANEKIMKRMILKNKLVTRGFVVGIPPLAVFLGDFTGDDYQFDNDYGSFWVSPLNLVDDSRFQIQILNRPPKLYVLLDEIELYIYNRDKPIRFTLTKVIEKKEEPIQALTSVKIGYKTRKILW